MRRLFHRIFAGEIHCRWCHHRIWRWQLVRDEGGRFGVMHAQCRLDFLASLMRRPKRASMLVLPIRCECGVAGLTHDGCPLD